MVLGEVRKTFNPEFINRIDEIIVFEALSDDDLRTITRLLVKQLNDNLVDRKIRLDLATEVVDWIIEQTCKDRSYGARPAAPRHPAVYRGSPLRGAHPRAPEGRGDRGIYRRRVSGLSPGRPAPGRPSAGLNSTLVSTPAGPSRPAGRRRRAARPGGQAAEWQRTSKNL